MTTFGQVTPHGQFQALSLGLRAAAARGHIWPNGDSRGLTSLYKQSLQIVQSSRVALRQQRCDFILAAQEVLECRSAAGLRRLSGYLPGTLEKARAGAGRESIVLLAGFEVSHAGQVPKLGQAVLLLSLAQIVLQPFYLGIGGKKTS